MIVNKVTRLFPVPGGVIDEAVIQAHLDVQNQDGWQLVCVDNMVGWYRFFWSKSVA